MQWSQLKKGVEERFAPKLRGRIQVWSTAYRKTHDQEGRGWLTLDSLEIWSMATLKAWVEQHRLASAQLTQERGGDWEDWGKIRYSREYWERWRALEEARRLEGFFTRDEFHEALRTSLQNSIDDSVGSDNVLVQGLAMIDRRLGKRRFQRLTGMNDAHPFVRLLHDIRAEAEGWPLAPVAA